MTIEAKPKHQSIELRFDVAALSLENVVSEMERLVAYARSKGAPADAAIYCELDQMRRDHHNDAYFGPPPNEPHYARIMWIEDEYQPGIQGA
jgi:hypothetical protein